MVYLGAGATAPARGTRGRLPIDAASQDEFGRLLAAAQNGDEDAFAAIWRKFNPQLLRYMRVMAAGQAEDLTAETWLQVTRKLLTFEGDETAFRAWLYTIARNRHIDWRRQSARRAESPVGVEALERQAAPDDPVATVEAKMSTDSALALLASLPEDQAEAVMLRAVAGLSVAAAAEIMGRPPGTVRVLCHRGLRKLEAMLRGTAWDPNRAQQDVVV